MNSNESKALFDKISAMINSSQDLCCKLSVLTDQIVRLYEGIDLQDDKFRHLHERLEELEKN